MANKPVPTGTPIRCNRCNAKFAAPKPLERRPFEGQPATRVLAFCECPQCGFTDCHWAYASDVMPEFQGSAAEKYKATQKWLREN